ncbi:MAG TPA: sugar phosphate isomerase/epimerase family protein [Chthonomonadaceae bacterium]|nr:sugar phosphate isomerase/epimerase family protein [Chthonomonadaceae bacterium]
MKLAAFPKCYMDDICVHHTMTIFDWIELAARELKPFGLTGLETYHGTLESHDPAYLARVRAAHEAVGLTAPMFCASPDFTSPDAAYRREQMDIEKGMIEATAALGGRYCRVLSGQRRPEVSREQGVGWVVDCIGELLPFAEAHGVVLILENHFKDNYWAYPEFAQKMEIFCEIVDRIDSPWFGVNFDPSNTLLANEDPIALLRRVAPRVVTMHASDRRPRPGVEVGPEGITDYSQLIHGEVGTGLIDYDTIFAILRDVGFDGWVSIEDGVAGVDELKRSAQFLARRMGLAVA